MFDLKSNKYNLKLSIQSWSWRPIHLLCDYLIMQKNYKISTEYWEASNGFGIDNQDECDLLAKELEEFISVKNFDFMYVNLGKWVYLDGTFVSKEKTEQLNKEYKNGFVLFTPLVNTEGEMVVPVHKTTIEQIKQFIEFLKKCGGFKIW